MEKKYMEKKADKIGLCTQTDNSDFISKDF